MKIGLFGGSFNPPHIGHVNAIKSILKEKLVDEIWVFVDRSHFRKNLIPLRHRETMVMMALRSIHSPKVRFVSNKSMSFDISNPSSLYVYKKCQKNFPNKKFYLVGGSDLLPELNKWRNSDEIKRAVKFLIVPRSGYPIKFKKNSWLYLSKKIKPITSSTQIRTWLKNKNYYGKYLPKKIFSYIQSTRLYKN